VHPVSLEYVLFPCILGATYVACVQAVSHLPEEQASLGALCVVLSALALSALLEKLLPRREEWSKSRGDTGSDFLQTNFGLPLFTKLTELSVAFGAVALTSRVPTLRFVHALWPSSWSLGAQMCLALPVTELGFYVAHRLCHGVPWLWKFHAHHHTSKRVYILNSGKFHPVDVAVQTLFYTAPLIVVGATPRFLAIFVAFSAVHGLFEHGNFRYRIGALDYLFNTNGLHQWHHSLKREEANTNYGKVLSIYDWMFGTRRALPGVSVGDVGIPEPVAERYIDQLLLRHRG
jgi:sterol desaturase/sphingolipid hydroxylase (fatty acid hydroxylase superfamily)